MIAHKRIRTHGRTWKDREAQLQIYLMNKCMRLALNPGSPSCPSSAKKILMLKSVGVFLFSPGSKINQIWPQKRFRSRGILGVDSEQRAQRRASPSPPPLLLRLHGIVWLCWSLTAWQCRGLGAHRLHLGELLRVPLLKATSCYLPLWCQTIAREWKAPISILLEVLLHLIWLCIMDLRTHPEMHTLVHQTGSGHGP